MSRKWILMRKIKEKEKIILKGDPIATVRNCHSSTGLSIELIGDNNVLTVDTCSKYKIKDKDGVELSENCPGSNYIKEINTAVK